MIDGKLVSWVINENLIPGYDPETKKYDPTDNPPTDEVYPFTVDFIKALEDNNSKCVPETAITAFRNNYREMMGIQVHQVECHGKNNTTGKKIYTYHYIDSTQRRVDEARLKKDFNNDDNELLKKFFDGRQTSEHSNV